VGASPYALALGATIVEKHFTIDKNMEGPDHVASLDPDELKDFVDSIKYVEQVLGNQNKEIVAGEKGNKEHMQKYIVAKQNINKGDLFNEDNITTKRTGGKGVPALKYFEVIGKSSHMDLQVNDIVRYE
jgi:N,N'-diacetyllegionaminate synthase